MKFPRIRFSLLSLLCFVLLLASAAALWWNWEAWTPQYPLPSSELGIRYAEFSPDDKLILAFVADPKHETADTVNIHDAASGKLLNSHAVSLMYHTNVKFSPGSRYVYVTGLATLLVDGNYDQNRGIWFAETGASVFNRDMIGRDFVVWKISPDDRFAVLSTDVGLELVTLPALNRIARWRDDDKIDVLGFSSGGKWLAFYKGAEIHLVATQTGKEEEYTFPVSSRPYHFAFSPSEDIIAFDSTSVERDENNMPRHVSVIQIYETTGRWLAKYEGTPLDSIFSPDGGRLSLLRESDPADTVCVVELGGNKPPLCVGEIAKPIAKPNSFQARRSPGAFHKHLFVTTRPLRAVDLRTGKAVYDQGNCTEDAVFFADNAYIRMYENASWYNEIRSVRTGLTVLSLPCFRWQNYLTEKSYPRLSLAHHTPMFITTIDKPETGNAPQCVVWRLVRPNLPWDAVKMIEFWLTVFFAGALAWSVFRRRPQQKVL